MYWRGLYGQFKGFFWIKSVFGNKRDNLLEGGCGRDILFGRRGDDTLDGGPGGDKLFAGRGDDTLIFDASDQGRKHWQWDVYNGGKGHDTLRLEFTAEQWERPDIKQDVLAYLDHLDRIESGDVKASKVFTFNSLKLSLKKVEQLQVLVDGEEIDPRDDGSVEIVDLSGSTDDEVVTVVGDSNTEVATGSGNDSITTGGGDDTVESGTGNDVVSTGNGDDVIHTGQGDDIVDGGEGFDVIRYDDDFTDGIEQNIPVDGIIANLELGIVTDPFGDFDTLTNVESIIGTDEDDNIVGSDAADQFSALGGNDFIDGGSGNDTLNGGQGNDFMLVGPGMDLLQFEAGDGNDIDTVEDFDLGDDKIELLGGLTIASISESELGGEPGLDTEIEFSSGDVVRLLNVSGVSNPDDLLLV